MSWKKNGFGYVMWLLYTLFAVWLLLEMSGASGVLQGTAAYAAALPAVVILSVAGLLALIFSQLAAKRVKRILGDAELAWLAEMAAVVVFLVLGVSDRIQRMTGVGELAPYFETAQVAAGQTLPQAVHGAEYLYLQLLHIVFLFLGNKFIAGIWLQIVLQLAAVLLLYPGVRKLAGPVPALAMTGLFMCSQFGMRMSLTLSPQMLYLLLFAAGVGLVAYCRGRKRILCFLAAGLWVGAAGYFDLSGFLLLLFLTAVAAQADERRRAGRFVLGFAGVAAGFFGSILLDAFLSGRPLMGVLEAWWQLYIPQGFDWSVLRISGSTGWGSLLLAVLLSFGVFSFWGGHGRERMSLWAFAAGCSVVMGCLGVLPAVMWADVYVYLFLAVLAGIGIRECFRTEERAAEASGGTEEPEAPAPGASVPAEPAADQAADVPAGAEQVNAVSTEAAALADQVTETVGIERPGEVQEPRKEAKMSEKDNEIKKTRVKDFEFIEVSLSAPINLELPKPEPEPAPAPEAPKTEEAVAAVPETVQADAGETQVSVTGAGGQSERSESVGPILAGAAAYGYGTYYGAQEDQADGQMQQPQSAPAEEVQPAQETRPVQEVQPAGEVQPAQETQSVQKERPAEEAQAVQDTQPAHEAKPAEEPPKETKYIDNPLPLPKPHKKRVLDYDRNSGEPADDYDYPVDENDDFDIK